MPSPESATFYSKRDFWLCHARAFAPPSGGDYLRAFASDLPADLEAISEELGLVVTAELTGFRAAVAEIEDPVELQRLYATLFLIPPAPVMMNTGIYLDGGLLGETEQKLQSAYARHGFERHEKFRDLNDTVGVQCEFLSLLFDKAGDAMRAGQGIDAAAYSAEAERFIAAYPCRWLTPFLRDLERACEDRALNPVYADLARMLWLSVEGATLMPGARIAASAEALLPQGSACGIGDLSPEDLAEIAWCLERDGLSWDHVAQNAGWDDEVFARRRAREEMPASAMATNT